jgi:phosphoglycolate phosphatase-like HAD superfamily hydrolase
MVFDLDGTLAESKASLDAAMATRLGAWLEFVGGDGNDHRLFGKCAKI